MNQNERDGARIFLLVVLALFLYVIISVVISTHTEPIIIDRW